MEKSGIVYKMCILFLCVSILAGCTQNAETKATDGGNIKMTFTKEELLADYDRLWEILEEDYIYLSVLESHGIDTKALEESTRQQLEERITDFEGFYYLLNSMFGKMQNFAHLGVVDIHTFDICQKYYNGEQAESNGWQKYLQNPQTQAVYEYLKQSPATQKEGRFSEVRSSYDAQLKAVTFRIKTFDDSVLERDRNVVSEYIASLNDAEIEHIIFDISGNGGGNDRYWMDNLAAPFGGDYEWSDWWYLRDTELTQEYFFDDFSPEPISNVTDHDLPAFVKELELTHFVKVQNQLSNDAVLPENVCTARRWVIIDKGVYSAADSFSLFCKSTGWATLVGRPTLGDGKGTAPLLVSLPHTGLLIRFSGLAAESPDGTLNALTGTAPDIRVKASEDPYEVIRRLMEEEVL